MDAIIYTRVSTRKQLKGRGPARQLEWCQEMADVFGLTVIETIEHCGSAYRGTGLLEELVEWCEDNPRDPGEGVVLTEDFDRLSRAGLSCVPLIQRISRSGWRIRTYFGGMLPAFTN